MCWIILNYWFIMLFLDVCTESILGTYTTKDGQTYVGEWNSDKLDETKEIEISYPDGTKYVGHLLDNKYSGTAIYKLEEKVSLLCDFIENKPTGEVTLIDPNKKVWHGFAEQDDCLLTPEHTFYRCIGKDLGKGSSRLKSNYKKKESISSNKDSQKSIDSTKPTKYKDIREIERKLFAKTKKTPSDLQFEKSQWYQDYINYKNTYGSIVCKAKLEGETSLTAEEWNWYWRYKDFEKKYAILLNNFRNKIKTGPIPDEKWFELIQSGKFMPKPVPIFYPTEKSDDDCDSNCECVND